jgi:hypothetical protein
MRQWFAACLLLMSLAPAALAGGLHAKIEGPGPDGVTYTARTYSCDPGATLEPWALAEGVVDSSRRSVLITLQPTAEHGVYQFKRTWPEKGTWMIRFNLGHPPAPATVTRLASSGRVLENKLYWKTDGSLECTKALRPLMRRHPGQKPGESDDDC